MTAQSPPSTTDLLRSIVKSAKGARNSLYLSGQQLGPYRIEDLLGEGSYAEVYRAVDNRNGRAVALKVLRESVESVPWNWAPFEAAALASAAHANVVAVLDAYVIRGHACVVLELLSDDTLTTRLHRGHLNSIEAASLGVEMCAALALLHTRGLVHGDVKPLNIVYDHEGHARLVDFGTAQRTVKDRVEGIGSPLYMAPEQAEKRSSATDVFNLAMTLVEAIAGAAAVMQIRAYIHHAEPIDSDLRFEQVRSALRSHMTSELAHELACALDFEPECRPTAEQFYRSLKWHQAPRATLAESWKPFVKSFCLLAFGSLTFWFAKHANFKDVGLVGLIFGFYFIGIPWLLGLLALVEAIRTSFGRVDQGIAVTGADEIAPPTADHAMLENYLNTKRPDLKAWLKLNHAHESIRGNIGERFVIQRVLWSWEKRTGYFAWDVKLQRAVIVEVGLRAECRRETPPAIETGPARAVLPALFGSYTQGELQYDVYEAHEGVFLSELLAREYVSYEDAMQIAERTYALLARLDDHVPPLVIDCLVPAAILLRPNGGLMFYALVRHVVDASNDTGQFGAARGRRTNLAYLTLERSLFERHLAAAAKSYFGPIFDHDAMLRLGLENVNDVRRLRDGRMFQWRRKMYVLGNALAWLVILLGLGVAVGVTGAVKTSAIIVSAFLLAASSAPTWVLWFACWFLPNLFAPGRSWQPPKSILTMPISLPDRTPCNGFEPKRGSGLLILLKGRANERQRPP